MIPYHLCIRVVVVIHIIIRKRGRFNHTPCVRPQSIIEHHRQPIVLSSCGTTPVKAWYLSFGCSPKRIRYTSIEEDIIEKERTPTKAVGKAILTARILADWWHWLELREFWREASWQCSRNKRNYLAHAEDRFRCTSPMYPTRECSRQTIALLNFRHVY